MTSGDDELVRASLAGDMKAFGRLYDRYAGIVRAISFESTGTVVDAQDLTQDVFMKAFERLSTLRDPHRFGPWLVGITRLASRQWRRARARDRHQLVGEIRSDAFPSDDSADTPCDDLHSAMMELGERERMALHLFYFDEQPAQQARRLMGLSTSGFYRTLDRARARIRERLREREETKP